MQALWLAVELAGQPEGAQLSVHVESHGSIELPDVPLTRVTEGGLEAKHMGDVLVVRVAGCASAEVSIRLGERHWGPAQLKRPEVPELSWWSA
jgi:hypothetical protein